MVNFMANINDLMLRYKTQTAGAIRKFITRHLEKINSDGIEHAKHTSEGWQFDNEAVRIIDELRGFSKVAIVEQVESERVKELQYENENLRQLLLIAQSKLIQTQEELQNNQQMLLASESQAKDYQAELKIEQTLHTTTKEQLKKTETQLEESTLQRSELLSQLDKLKNRGLLDRLFNRF